VRREAPHHEFLNKHFAHRRFAPMSKMFMGFNQAQSAINQFAQGLSPMCEFVV